MQQPPTKGAPLKIRVDAVVLKSDKRDDVLLIKLPEWTPLDEDSLRDVHARMHRFTMMSLLLAGKKSDGEWLIYGDKHQGNVALGANIESIEWAAMELEENPPSRL
jgi:hypothetical protein